MVARWFLGFALALQIFTAVNAANKADPNLPQIIQNYDQSFKKTDKNLTYLQKYASGKMDTIINQVNGSTQVSNRIKDSIADSETGKKVNITAKVTQTANKAKVAETLAERLSNAKKYAKNVGKASIPVFVGTAAFHGLMEGIGWVMDEGGKVTKKPDTNTTTENTDGKYTSDYQYYIVSNDNKEIKAYTVANACITFFTYHNTFQNVFIYSFEGLASSASCKDKAVYRKDGALFSTGTTTPKVRTNPHKNTTPPESVVVSDAELQTALKNALESNNAAQAKAIADAIKAAYTPDNSQGQSMSDSKSNGLATDAADSAIGAVRKAGASTGEEPTAGGKPGYYKITDGDKTIEGYVYPSDTSSTGTTDSTTTTNPDGSTTTTGSTATSWPNFCDWAGVVCEFIDWVKEDEQLEEEEPEKIDDSIFSRTFDIDFQMDAACPPNPIWDFEFVGQQWSKEIDITMICDFFKYLGYALLFASNMTALWIVYSAVVVRDQA